MLVLLLELVLAFTLHQVEGKEDQAAGGPFGNLDCVSLLINKPDRPVRVKFTPRAGVPVNDNVSEGGNSSATA